MLSQFFLGFTELQSRFPHGHSPSGSSRGEFPCVFQLLVMVVFLDCDCIAHISACVVILPSPLPYVVSFWLCFIRTLVIAFGNHLDNPGRYHHLKTLNSVTSAKSLLPHKGTFTRSRDQALNIFGGHNCNYLTSHMTTFNYREAWEIITKSRGGEWILGFSHLFLRRFFKILQFESQSKKLYIISSKFCILLSTLKSKRGWSGSVLFFCLPTVYHAFLTFSGNSVLIHL